MPPACCAASRGESSAAPHPDPGPGAGTAGAHTGADTSVVHLPDGFPSDGQGPVRRVTLSPFGIDRYATSGERFAQFVDATGYRTDAERYGWSFVFAGLLPPGYPSPAR